MGRLWAILFLLVPVLGVAVFVLSPVYGHDLPQDVSARGYHIDGLYYFILVLTGLVFIATEGCLFWFMWKYDRAKNPEPVKYTHGNHNLEIVWTIIPAGTLLFIAIYQINVWADVTYISRQPEHPDYEIEVVARQFEWRLRYPGPDGKFDTPDDIYHVNDLHIPANREVLIHLKSMDVLHSFFLPNFRVKQDAVPGMTIPVWFRGTEVGQYDLVCAELCGWGHYKMKGRVTVQEEGEFKKWLAEMHKDQEGE